MSDDVSWPGRDGDGELGLVAKISLSSVTQKLSSMIFFSSCVGYLSSHTWGHSSQKSFSEMEREFMTSPIIQRSKLSISASR